MFSNGISADVAFLSDAVDIFVMMTKAWPEVRRQFENQHCGLATDLANMLLIAQCDQESLEGFKDDQGKCVTLTGAMADIPAAALRLLVTPTLASREWSRAILQSVAPGSLVLRYLVAAGAASSHAEDSSTLREDDEGSEEALEEDSEKDVSLPLGLLYNLMDAAADGGRTMLLQTGKSLYSELAPANCPCRIISAMHSREKMHQAVQVPWPQICCLPSL